MNLLTPYVKFGALVSTNNIRREFFARMKQFLGYSFDEDTTSYLNSFFDDGEINGWLNQLRTFHFPIWGNNPEANGMNWVNPYGPLATFGAVDVSNSQVVSAGGAMDLKYSPSKLESNNCGLGFYLTSTTVTPGVDMGARNGAGGEFYLYNFYSSLDGSFSNIGTNAAVTSPEVQIPGFYYFNSTPAGRILKKKDNVTETITVVATGTPAAGPTPDLSIYAMGLNDFGVETYPALGRGYCCFAIWDSLTNAQADQFATATFQLEQNLRA